jgi:hypothetical protein
MHDFTTSQLLWAGVILLVLIYVFSSVGDRHHNSDL